MVDRAEQLQEEWLIDKNQIGITAGASAPEILVQQVISRLKQIGVEQTGKEMAIEELGGVVETVVFPITKGLVFNYYATFLDRVWYRMAGVSRL